MAEMANATILLVDDDEDWREIVTTFLMAHGFTVAAAADGAAALQQLERLHDVKAILLDLKMPGMDGQVFHEVLKKDHRFTDVPVLLVTSDTLAQLYARNMKTTSYLLKPLDMNTLLDAITASIGAPPQRIGSPRPGH